MINRKKKSKWKHGTTSHRYRYQGTRHIIIYTNRRTLKESTWYLVPITEGKAMRATLGWITGSHIIHTPLPYVKRKKETDMTDYSQYYYAEYCTSTKAIYIIRCKCPKAQRPTAVQTLIGWVRQGATGNSVFPIFP